MANEIPPDLVRWMDPVFVREALEGLIARSRRAAPPGFPLAYANFPTTEYLEPANAGFTAFNVYLELRAPFRRYLRRLHNIAGDRPLLVSEAGLDTRRHPEDFQAQLLPGFLEDAHASGCAGITFYAWSDLWQNGGREVSDWDFGLTRRDASAKPALEALSGKLRDPALHRPPALEDPPKISVVICTRNGASRLRDCLRAATALDYPDHEVLVVDDGSTDSTRNIVEEFPSVRYLYQDPAGLSAARNAGAEASAGSIIAYTDDDCQPDPRWLSWVTPAFADPGVGAAGGPNLPPPPRSASEAVAAAAPGAPTHILLDDTTAEHLPGCNLVVRKSALEKIGGFNPLFHAAGDDVDFCWRLRDAHYRLAFVPAAFVWHHRRPTLRCYHRQQAGYGEAEALLFQTHPERFGGGGKGGIRWEGAIYTGAPVRVEPGLAIYHGPLGLAPYQSLATRHLPRRPLPPAFDTSRNRFLLRLCEFLHQPLRALAFWRHGAPFPKIILPRKPAPAKKEKTSTCAYWSAFSRQDFLDLLQQHGWAPCAEERWDLGKDGLRLLAATETHRDATRHLLRLNSPRRQDWNAITPLLDPAHWKRTGASGGSGEQSL